MTAYPSNYVCRRREVLDNAGCGRLAISVARADAEVKALVIRVLSDPKHARQIARQSVKLGQAQTRHDAATSDALELARRLGEGRLGLNEYDAAMGPLNIRITRPKADVDTLRAAGADQSTRAATAAEITTEWETATIAQRRIMIQRVTPRGILVKPATRFHQSTYATAAERLEVL